MNQVTVVAYPPGAYGSFICWMIERFSVHRMKHEPKITDNPLMPDGSSHAYASFCKVDGVGDFIDGLNEARWDLTKWYTSIYAGWPCNPLQDIKKNVHSVLDWMRPYDKMIYVELVSESDWMLAYLRNEATLDRDRWFKMLGISSEAQLADRLRYDIESHDLGHHIYDPRLLRIKLWDILVAPQIDLWKKINNHLGWPMEDYHLFSQVIEEMRQRQEKFYHMIDDVGPDGSPAQRAIWKYLMEKNNGS